MLDRILQRQRLKEARAWFDDDPYRLELLRRQALACSEREVGALYQQRTFVLSWAPP